MAAIARLTLPIQGLSGSNSVVECNLAKVDVAGSNPVSRSKDASMRPVRGRAFFLLVSTEEPWADR